MLSNDRQRARLCRAVLAPVFGERSFALFADHGPTQRAWALYDAGGGPLSSTEHALLLTAFALWRGTDDGPAIGVLLHRLGTPAAHRLAAIMSLLCAPAAVIEQWLDTTEAADGLVRH